MAMAMRPTGGTTADVALGPWFDEDRRAALAARTREDGTLAADDVSDALAGVGAPVPPDVASLVRFAREAGYVMRVAGDGRRMSLGPEREDEPSARWPTWTAIVGLRGIGLHVGLEAVELRADEAAGAARRALAEGRETAIADDVARVAAWALSTYGHGATVAFAP